MIVLGIESSCDETAAAVCENGRRLLSDVIYSQADIHALYGGVVPEIASRKHAEKISYVVSEALKRARVSPGDVDVVAATCAPGLIGALLVGANFAKACALGWDKPFVPVHHIRGHIAANYICFPELKPPFIALIASGGHTLIAHVRDYTGIEIMGTTRDDAAGETFDKIARVMGLPYPGGVKLDELSQGGDQDKYRLPRAEVAGDPMAFSFSGIKTAGVNLIHNAEQSGKQIDRRDLAAGIARSISEALVSRIFLASELTDERTIVAAGGVAANSTLRKMLTEGCSSRGLKLYMPPLSLCGDNGAMIAAQGYYEFKAGHVGKPDQNCYANMPINEQFGVGMFI